MSKVTLRSIAEASGLSPSGVSKALSGHPKISQETIKRVNDLARKLNYQPSCFGTALKTGRTSIFGIVGHERGGVSQYTYMPRLFDTVMNECHKRGLDLVMFDALDTWPHGNEQMPRVLARGLVEGVFLISPKLDNPLYKRLLEQSVPLVIISDIVGIAANSVAIDLYQEGRIAVEHLHECGAKRIFYIETETERMYSFCAAMDGGIAEASKREGLEYFKEEINTSWYNLPAGRINVRRHIRRLLSHRETFSTEPVGIITLNDTIGQYVLTTALEFGIRVPERLMVVGHTNDMNCELSSPPLSSFDYFTVMAPLAIEMLIERIEQGNKNLPNKKIIPVLIKRASTVGE